MDYLWTPWRYCYVTTADTSSSGPSCIFCELLRAGDDVKSLIVHRGKHNFVILNAFPYTCGHGMIVPYEHVDRLHRLPAEAAEEMMGLSQHLEAALIDLYRPDGVNLGMNIGKAAGAGIAGHIHMHVLPRWVADANFMTVVGETRVLPEALATTYARLKAKF
ncbi:MAG: HIT domain-containing protein [Candidatus Korobacteraceae bacterium]